MASYVIAVTGASGASYGLRLIEELLRRGDDVDLIISPSGFLPPRVETGFTLAPGGGGGADVAETIRAAFKGARGKLGYTPSDELTSPLASGSALKKTMVICPCSMGTLARVATGVSGNLIERAADCTIKENGRLVLVPRETPLSAIHLENMLKLARLGVAIVPAMPAFYSKPETLDDAVDFVVGKVLDVLGVENDLYKRWTGKE